MFQGILDVFDQFDIAARAKIFVSRVGYDPFLMVFKPCNETLLEWHQVGNASSSLDDSSHVRKEVVEAIVQLHWYCGVDESRSSAEQRQSTE